MLFILLWKRYEFGALLVGVFMARAELDRVGPRHSQAQFNIRAGGRANAFQVLARPFSQLGKAKSGWAELFQYSFIVSILLFF